MRVLLKCNRIVSTEWEPGWNSGRVPVYHGVFAIIAKTNQTLTGPKKGKNQETVLGKGYHPGH